MKINLRGVAKMVFKFRIYSGSIENLTRVDYSDDTTIELDNNNLKKLLKVLNLKLINGIVLVVRPILDLKIKQAFKDKNIDRSLIQNLASLLHLVKRAKKYNSTYIVGMFE